MDNVDFKVIFQAHGFIPGVDMTEEELKKVYPKFVEMYNTFCAISDLHLEQINRIWDKYEEVKARAELIGGVGVFALEEAREFMCITEDTTYADWVCKWYKEFNEEVDKIFPDYGLISTTYRYGEDILNYGVRFKDNPKWGIDFSLEAM